MKTFLIVAAVVAVILLVLWGIGKYISKSEEKRVSKMSREEFWQYQNEMRKRQMM